MSSSISKFLKKLYVEGVYYTHVSMINPKGKYQLNRDSNEEFWELYNQSLITEGNNFIIGLAEKPQNYMPVLCDIDIKKTEEEMEYLEVNNNKMYTEKNLHMVIEIYQSVLRNIIEDCTDEHLLCVVLEKDMYTLVKNGLKILSMNKYKNHFNITYLNFTNKNLFIHNNDFHNEKINNIYKGLSIHFNHF